MPKNQVNLQNAQIMTSINLVNQQVLGIYYRIIHRMVEPI